MQVRGKAGLKHRTIKSYLSGVKHMHIMQGLGDPFKQPLEQLHYILRGVKRCESEQGMVTRERLPISPEIWHKGHVVGSVLFSLLLLPVNWGTNGPRGRGL